VEIREWWAADPEERFWIEITDRVDLGANLLAPTTDHSGKATWSYTLVSHVRPGDVVLHWWKQGDTPKAVVAFSTVVAPAEDSDIEWVAHGTHARGERMRTRPAWLVRLDNFTELARPVSLDDFRAAESKVRAVRQDLLERHGDPLYFPFAVSEKRPLRTTQGYLAKFPKDLMELFPDLSDGLGGVEPPRNPAGSGGGTQSRSGGAGYQTDSEAKKEIERCAVERAIEYLEREGWSVEDVGTTRSFDLLAHKDDRELHVEVKGSSGVASTVELTAGEVTEADTHDDSLLVVVDRIELKRKSSSQVKGSGGRARAWWNTTIDHDRLQPTRFRYLLPEGSTEF